MKPLTASIVAAVALVATPAFAQVDFSGHWTLDRSISSDLTKATLEPPAQSQPRQSTGGFSGRGFGGGVGGGRRQGQTGGTDRTGARGAALTDDERLRLREIAAFLKTLATMDIEHTDHSTLTVSDPQGHAHLFPTDGTKTPQSFATTTIDSVTKWDGPHLETLLTIGPTHDLVLTYILVPATNQMALRIRLEESGRVRADVPELKFVYKRQPPTHSAEGSRH
jgi:hypothetical protein